MAFDQESYYASNRLCSIYIHPYRDLRKDIERKPSKRPAVLLCGAALVILGLFASTAMAQDAAQLKRGADLFFGCDFDIGGTNACLPETRFDVFDGNGRRCYTCHRPSDNFGLTEERVKTIGINEPYFAAAREVPGLDDLDMLQLALIETPTGLKNSAGLINLQDQCAGGGCHTYGEDCTIPLGHMQERNNSLRQFIRDAVETHLTRDIQRRPDIDFRYPTDDELDDIIVFMLSDNFQNAAKAKEEQSK
jgi:hypothetical protein